MRHLRSILYALVLGPSIWVLAGVGFTNDLSSRGREFFSAESISGLLLLIFAGILYAILTFAPVSPAGPVLTGAAFLGVTIWAFNSPEAYASLWAPEVAKDGFDLSRPGYGLAGLLAIPLLGTALSARRWARYEPPVLPIIGEIGRFRGAAKVAGTPVAAEQTTVIRPATVPAAPFSPAPTAPVSPAVPRAVERPVTFPPVPTSPGIPQSAGDRTVAFPPAPSADATVALPSIGRPPATPARPSVTPPPAKPPVQPAPPAPTPQAKPTSPAPQAQPTSPAPQGQPATRQAPPVAPHANPVAAAPQAQPAAPRAGSAAAAAEPTVALNPGRARSLADTNTAGITVNPANPAKPPEKPVTKPVEQVKREAETVQLGGPADDRTQAMAPDPDATALIPTQRKPPAIES